MAGDIVSPTTNELKPKCINLMANAFAASPDLPAPVTKMLLEPIIISSNLLIASINTTFVGQGVSVFDLKDRICSKIQNLQIQYRLNEVIIKTLGNDISRLSEMYIDYQSAVDSIAYYDAREIPSINIDCIPVSVNNVHFDSNLSGICSIGSSQISKYQSALFNCIRI